MVGHASNLDLLNAFWADLHNPKTWKTYHDDRRRFAQDTYARYRMALAQARPFSIDERALKIAYKLSLESPEAVVKRLMLARLPFPKTWIEYDFHARVRIADHLGSGTGEGIAWDSPYRIGYLIEEAPNDAQMWAVTTITLPQSAQGLPAGARTEMSCVTWLVDTLNRRPPLQIGGFKQMPLSLCEGMVQDRLDLDKSGYPSIRHLGWGYSASDDAAAAFKVDRMRIMAVPECLENSINIGLTPLMQNVCGLPDVNTNRLQQIILNNAVEMRGDVRILVALLSLINEVPIIKEYVRPSGRVHMGGVIRPYLQNTIVKIDIPTRRYMSVVRNILRNAQIQAKARHEVRGHWRTIVHKHTHERVRRLPDGTIERKWIHEGELERVWVESHERGDASLGYVKHKYVVEKGPQSHVRPI
jgi:hypothetical protein